MKYLAKGKQTSKLNRKTSKEERKQKGSRDDAEVNGSSCYITCRACQAVQMNELIMALGNVIRTLKDDAQGAHV